MNEMQDDQNTKSKFAVKHEESLELLKDFLMIEDPIFAPISFQWSNRRRAFNRKDSLTSFTRVSAVGADNSEIALIRASATT